MNFKFHNDNGREVKVTSMEQLIKLIKKGDLQSNTLLYDEATNLWKPAWELDIYHQAILTLNSKGPNYDNTPLYGEAGASSTQVAQSTPLAAIDYSAYEPMDTESTLLRISSILLAALVALMGGILLLLTVAFYAPTAKDAAGMVSIPIFIALGFSLLFLPVWCLFLKNSRSAGLCLCSIVFTSLTIFTFINAWGEAKESRAALEEFESMMNKFNSQARLLKKTFRSREYGNYAPVLQISYDRLRGMQNDAWDFMQEMKEHHPETLLLWETLKDRASIDDGQRRLQATLETFDKYETMTRQRSEEVENNIAKAKIPESTKTAFRKSFRESSEASLSRAEGVFDILRSMLSKIDEVLNMMRDAQGRYSLTGNRLLFRAPGDLRAYQQHLAEIQDFRDRIITLEWEERQRRQEDYDEFYDKVH